MADRIAVSLLTIFRLVRNTAMPKYHHVTLSPTQRQQLLSLISSGMESARTLSHARILLHADDAQPDGAWLDQEIAQALHVGLATVERVRRKFAGGGLEAALYRTPPPKRPPEKMDGDAEAHLVALTCSAPPGGQKRWTLRLLAQKMVEMGYVDSLSHESVRQTLKKTNSSPG
jgi:transposase